MRIKNSQHHYGIITILFHWLIAALIIGLSILGLYMVDMPITLKKLKFYTLHKELGMAVLVLAALRLLWRLINKVPDLTDAIPRWQALSALAAHWTFYGLMFAMPLSGWYIISAAGVPLSFFGWFLIPNLMAKSREWIDFFTAIHAYLGYALIIMIGIHTGAALLHHFYYRDDVLKRIFK